MEAQIYGTGRCRQSHRRRCRQRTAKRRHIDRNREAGNELLVRDYFCNTPTYTDAQFRPRFRMRRHVFRRIVGALEQWSGHFQRTRDALGKKGFSPFQKYNATTPDDRMMTAKQCKYKWLKINVKIREFNSMWCDCNNQHSTGQGDEDLVENTMKHYDL
jgi:hypothetical protein